MIARLEPADRASGGSPSLAISAASTTAVQASRNSTRPRRLDSLLSVAGIIERVALPIVRGDAP